MSFIFIAVTPRVEIKNVLFAFPAGSASHWSMEGCVVYCTLGPGQKTWDKPYQTQRPCFLPSYYGCNDILARVCTRWQLQTGCISETTVQEGHEERQGFLFPNMWQFLDSKGIIDRQTLWKDLIYGHCVSLPDSMNARSVDLKRGPGIWYFPRVLLWAAVIGINFLLSRSSLGKKVLFSLNFI